MKLYIIGPYYSNKNKFIVIVLHLENKEPRAVKNKI